MSPPALQVAMPPHSFDKILDGLAEYLGIRGDPIHQAIFLSLASGCLAAPIPLDVASNSLTADLTITRRILDLRRTDVRRIDTLDRLRELEREGFAGCVALMIRGAPPSLFREACEMVARPCYDRFRPPSPIRITDHPPPRPSTPSALRITTALADRDLDSFGGAYAVGRGDRGGGAIAELLRRLPAGPRYPCGFRHRFRGSLRSDDMLLFERLLLVFAAIRTHDFDSADASEEVTVSDYRRARDLLVRLPVCPVGASVSPRALEIAQVIFDVVRDGSYQLTLPDRSAEGARWFRRAEAAGWTSLSYTATKRHLQELEAEGVLLSTVEMSDRRRGREIHYRFLDDRAAPSGWRNPFEALPGLDGSDGS